MLTFTEFLAQNLVEWSGQTTKLKGIPIYCGVDSNGNVEEENLREEHSSCFIIGMQGSGKTNLLRVVLASAHTVAKQDVDYVVLDDGKGLLPSNHPLVATPDEFFPLLYAELWHRVDIMKMSNVSSIREHNLLYPEHSVKRIFAVIDNFQSIYDQPDKLNIIKQVLRIGSSSGIHLLLAGRSVVQQDPKEVLNSCAIRIATNSDPISYYTLFNEKMSDPLALGECLLNNNFGQVTCTFKYKVPLITDEEFFHAMGGDNECQQ